MCEHILIDLSHEQLVKYLFSKYLLGSQTRQRTRNWPTGTKHHTCGLQLHYFKIATPGRTCYPVYKGQQVRKAKRISMSILRGLSGVADPETENISLFLYCSALFKGEVPKWNRECSGCFKGIFPLCDTTSPFSIFSKLHRETPLANT